ncbi:MAG: hypothetical protein JWO70_1680 [Betaproteobacteria bacterium]|nr:hypothetical protein [Betaproteobacteria bacterium]
MASTDEKVWLCVTLIFIGTFALVMPLIRYVTTGWKAKRKDIMDGLDAHARMCYFEMFSRSGATPAEADASKAFEQLYTQWYGRRFFLVPGLLLFAVGVIAVTVVTFTCLHRLGYMHNPLFDVPDIAMAALAGAYLWVLNDHISRARSLDFSPADVHWGVLRLIIAAPMGYAFAAIASKSLGPFVAFAVGAFPLEALTSMLRRLAEKNLNVAASPEETSDDIIKLQGINKPIVERLSKEDITSITQLAYCDPVRLAMRSNLTFNFIIDCMNQALAWLYLQEQLNTIRPLSLRGASEIKDLMDSIDDPAADHDGAVQALPKIAEAIKQDPVTLKLTLRQVAEDPYTIFLHRVWT